MRRHCIDALIESGIGMMPRFSLFEWPRLSTGPSKTAIVDAWPSADLYSSVSPLARKFVSEPALHFLRLAYSPHLIEISTARVRPPVAENSP